MATYNLSNALQYTTLTDQTGSSLFDSGGPTGSYQNNESYYVLISPAYSTGAVTVNITSFNSEANFDYLRIYDGIPNTSSFAYNGTTETWPLLKVLSGTPSVPVTVTASSGKAYIRWSSNASTTGSGFKLEWTGSGFYTADSSSGVSYNSKAVNFPKSSTSGTYITFDKGRFTGSSTLPSDRDIIFSFWAKLDEQPYDNTRGIFSLGDNGLNGSGARIVIYKSNTSNDITYSYVDNATGSFFKSSGDTGFLIGGLQSSNIYNPPSWHQYSVLLRKTSSTDGELRFYRDGAFVTSQAITKATAWSNLTTTKDLVLGTYKDTGVILNAINTWSGSLDDVFMATAITGASTSSYNSLFASLYNSGTWVDPTSKITSSLSPSYSGTVLFNWRFEESTVLGTRDYGSYGNVHSASYVFTSSAGSPNQISSSTGISYTAYSSLVYSASANSNATISFSGSSASVYENTASYYIGLLAKTASVGLTTTAAVVTSSEVTSAVLGTNYNLIYGGTTYSSSAQLPIYVSWAAGDTSTKYITASIFDNTVYTGTSSSFKVTINTASSTNLTRALPYDFTLNILDYEEGYPSFSSFYYSTGESTSSTNLTVNRISGSNGPLSVQYSSSNQDAIAGVNYGAVSGTLTWTDGDSTSRTITVPIYYDGVYSPSNKYFNVSLYNISTGSFSSYPSANTTALVEIVDQEPGTFNWQVTSLSAYETGTLATVNVLRTSGTYGAVTVNVSGSSSLAQPIRSTMTGTLSFANGETSKQFTINISDDLIDESNDIIYYRLYPTSSIVSAPTFTGSSGLLAFTLIDNETGSVTLSTGSASLYENTSSYVFSIQRLYGGDQAETASISYAGTAVENTDYNVIYNSLTQSSPFNVTWSDGDTSTKYITASIHDNNLLDPVRNVVFGIASSSISAIGPTSSLTLTIYDYEITGSVRFLASSYTGTVPSTLTIGVERYDGKDVSASAIVNVYGGTAIAGTDYTNIFPYTVNWNNQESGSKYISLELLSTWNTNKTLSLSLSSLTNLSSGTIMSSSVLMANTFYTQSSQQYSNYSSDYVINKYLNLSNQYDRRTQQVPFSLGTNPLTRLQQAYSAST